MEEIFSSSDFTRCVQFHGHTCPGLAIGFQAAMILMKQLDVRKAPDEELLAIVETDACGADAIQVMTGCTLARGTLSLKTTGNMLFPLWTEGKEKAYVCVSCLMFSGLTRNISPFPKRFRVMRHRQRKQNASDNSSRSGSKKVLEADPESLFKIEEISADIPAKARIMESEICDICGEPTKGDLLHKMNSKKICIPCAEGHKIF